jgi:predicted metal-dependent hydrolase
MTIRPDRSVSVRVPLRTPLYAIREFVARQAAWIARTREKIANQSPEPAQSYADGAPFLFLGDEFRLALEPGPQETVRLRGDSLVVATPAGPSPCRLKELVDCWYREQAAELFRERLIACHIRMEPERLEFPLLTIRPMKSRWGSYSYRTRRVTLNLHLIRLPLACLDYVIIHELCHIAVRHHGPLFWRLVERYFPDHAEARRQLREISPSLP